MSDRNAFVPPTEPASAALVDDVARLVKLADPRLEIPADRLDRMQEELRPLWEDRISHSASRRLRPALAAAAVLVFGLTTVLALRTWLPGADPVATVARVDGEASSWRQGDVGRAERMAAGTSLPAGRVVATTAGSRLALDTPVGRSVRLDRDSRIVWLSASEVRLEQGALYVDSPSTLDSPALTVVTALGRIEEIGTQFEVRLSADTLTVRVREGRVAMGWEQTTHQGRAGEELTLSGGRFGRRPIPPHSSLFAWSQEIAPTWHLNGSRLDEFLIWAAREAGRPLRWADPRLEQEARSIVLAGEIEGLAPAEAVEVVLPAVGFSALAEEGSLLIIRADETRRPRGPR
jgi:ferric-dicitrate binding protein FerR (iron transport regulator)